MKSDHPQDPNRRDFLKTGAAAVAGAAAAVTLEATPAAQAAYSATFAAPPIPDRPHRLRRRRPAGLRARAQPAADSRLPGHRRVRHPVRTDRLGDQGDHWRPASRRRRCYNRGPRDFERLCETEDLDLVYTATPWEWHVPVMLAGDEERQARGDRSAGGDDARRLLGAWSRPPRSTRKHCVMMENCNYDRMEMMVFNMVRQGLFGEMLHAEGGYLHDLRGHQVREPERRAVAAGLVDEARRQSVSDARPRPDRQLPRHQPRRPVRLPRVDERPVARPAGLGGRALSGRRARAAREVRARRRQHQPDQDGEAAGPIMVQHCTNLPRPYSRINIVQGTKGLFQGYPNRAYIEGRGRARSVGRRRRRCSRSSSIRCGRKSPRRPRAPGHGGMDFIEDYRLIKCLREGTPTDMNVYDAAALSAVVDRELPVGGAARPAGRDARLHARPVAHGAAARDRPHVRSGDDDTRVSWPSGWPLPASTGADARVARGARRATPRRRSSATLGRAARWAWFVPGRIEVFGKHTDYAGGRSLVAAVPRGFAVVAGPRTRRHRLGRRRAMAGRDGRSPRATSARSFTGWANYVAVVARRLASNFPGAELGTDSCSRATCRVPPGSAARRRSSSPWRRRSSGAPASSGVRSGSRRSADGSISPDISARSRTA